MRFVFCCYSKEAGSWWAVCVLSVVSVKDLVSVMIEKNVAERVND